jgi:hypothetical protein
MVALAIIPEATAAQSPAADHYLAPLAVVLENRLAQIDSTLFDTCTIYEKVGRPDDLITTLGASARLLDRQDLTCDAPADNWRQVILLEYLVGESRAYVVVRAYRGEHAHVEEYRLRFYPTGPWWRVEEVSLSGWAQFRR